MYGRKAWDVVGYTFQTETYCPEHIIDALPTGEGESYDGWATVLPMSTEDNLSEIAFAFGIDRMDEYSFDSDEFPKVIFSDSITENDICTVCQNAL